MTKKEIELAAIVVLGGLFAWLWFTKSGKQIAASAGSAIATGAEKLANVARGVRNNNPGNIRISSNAWVGKIPTQQNTDGAFEQFQSMSDGIRALGKNLLTYFDRYSLNTVRGIINRYAPPSENITGSYVNAVSDAVGVQPDDAINLRDSHMLSLLIEGIIRHENGAASAAMVSDADIRSGIERALA
jgi:hypothetical protein